MRGLKNIVWKLLNIIGIGGAINLHLESGLKDDGWFVSFRKKQSVDKQGQPIPWLTYPFIKFLSNRLDKNFRLFEFGSGNSTLWYAARVKQVIAVEHHQQWYDQVVSSMPDNAQVVFKHQNQGKDYEQAILEPNIKFDVVIIDGIKRVECALYAVQAVTDNGVIILDNSDRSIYQPIKDQLKEAGYKSLDFWGPAPVAAINSCTTIFYQSNNCFNI